MCTPELIYVRPVCCAAHTQAVAVPHATVSLPHDHVRFSALQSSCDQLQHTSAMSRGALICRRRRRRARRRRARRRRRRRRRFRWTCWRRVKIARSTTCAVVANMTPDHASAAFPTVATSLCRLTVPLTPRLTHMSKQILSEGVIGGECGGLDR